MQLYQNYHLYADIVRNPRRKVKRSGWFLIELLETFWRPKTLRGTANSE